MSLRYRAKTMAATALLGAAVLSGCSSSQGINDVSVGMTKQEVIRTLGSPTSTNAQGGTEVLTYNLYAGFTANPWYQLYYVRLQNGRVVAYGQ